MEKITKEQYGAILDQCEKYIKLYEKMFPNKPMSEDFAAGMRCVLDIIEPMVTK